MQFYIKKSILSDKAEYLVSESDKEISSLTKNTVSDKAQYLAYSSN